MRVHKAAQREWRATDYAGIERSLLRNNEGGGRTSLVRLAAGARFPRHTHLDHEDVLVISGEVRIGGHSLLAGDYLDTGAGESHDVKAVTDAVIYVSSQRPTPLLGE